MVQFDLFAGGHVYIAMEHAESVGPGEGHGSKISSIVTMTSGATYDVLGHTGEVAEKLSHHAPLTTDKAKEISERR